MSYSHTERQKIFNHTNGRCHYCKKELKFEDYGKRNKSGAWEVDHIIPKKMGGPDFHYNLAPIHPECNRKKADKLFDLQSIIFNPVRTELQGN